MVKEYGDEEVSETVRELDDRLEDGEEVIYVEDEWKYRVVETPDEMYYWQCLLCGAEAEEKKDTTNKVKLGGMGHAKSHGRDKRHEKEKIIKEGLGLDKDRDEENGDKINPDEFLGELEKELDDEEEEKKKKNKWEAYEKPLTATECLTQIMNDYRDRLKAGFMKMVIRRSKRMGGIHPVELPDWLLDMNSGVNNQREARLIAEEYRDLLEHERQKADKLDVNLSYPLEMDTGDSKRVSKRGLGMGRSRYDRDERYSGRESSDYRRIDRSGEEDYERDKDRDEDKETKLVKELIRSKDKELDRLSQMREEKMELQQEMEKVKHESEISKLEAQIDRLGDKFESAIEKIAETTTSDNGGNQITKEDMELMLEKRDAEHRADKVGEKMDRVMKKLDSYEERMKELEEERNELQRELYEEKSRTRTDPGDWESDEYRMMSSMGNKAIQLGEDWVRESKKNRRLVLKSLFEEGKISKEEAEEMMEDTKKGEAEVLKEYLDEDDVED